jgi:hypothetical protein
MLRIDNQIIVDIRSRLRDPGFLLVSRLRSSTLYGVLIKLIIALNFLDWSGTSAG